MRGFVEGPREEVFSSRQIEVVHEGPFFHWVTNRAIRDLIEEGTLVSEMRALGFGGSVKLIWHHSYRYPKRKATKLTELIDEYSNPNMAGALGLHGESMVLEAFAREKLLMVGRESREYGSRTWPDTEHDPDSG